MMKKQMEPVQGAMEKAFAEAMGKAPRRHFKKFKAKLKNG